MVDSHEQAAGPFVSRRVLRGFTPARFTAVRKPQMTVSDLARITGVAGTTIYGWESGHASPQVDKLAAAMKVLGHPIEEVVLIPLGSAFPAIGECWPDSRNPNWLQPPACPQPLCKKIERGESLVSDERASILGKILDITGDEYRAAWQRVRERPPGTPA